MRFRGYFEEYLSAAPIHHVGVSRFQTTWTSEVEREALRRAYNANRHRDNSLKNKEIPLTFRIGELLRTFWVKRNAGRAHLPNIFLFNGLYELIKS